MPMLGAKKSIHDIIIMRDLPVRERHISTQLLQLMKDGCVEKQVNYLDRNDPPLPRLQTSQS